MTLKKSSLYALSLTLLLVVAQSVNPVSNCLGNCIACENNNPSYCRPLLQAATGKEYACIPYYAGTNCSQTVNSYYNFYKENGTFLNWSLPSPPPSQTCSFILPNTSSNASSSNLSFNSIGPFTSSLNATKSLSFSLAQSIQRLIIKITVAVADQALYNESLYSTVNSTQTTDAQGNIIIETVTTTGKNTTLTRITPFLNLAVSDQLNSNSLIAAFNTFYEVISSAKTSCGFVYQYQFVVDTNSTSVFRQILLNFYLSSQNSQTTWYLLGFSAEGGCSGFSVTSGVGKCQTCLSGYYSSFDPDGSLMSCNLCDYRCSTCSSSSQCLLCQAYTTSSTPGQCIYPSAYKVYTTFNAITGTYLNLSSSVFKNLASSQSQALNLGLTLNNDQSYFIKFYLLYSLNYAQNLNQLNITVNGKPFTSYTTLDTHSSTLLREVNNGGVQLFSTVVKIDLMGKPCLSNFSIGLKGSAQVNEQFYVANLVVVQYSCGDNCLDCSFNPSQQTATCKQCAPFFSLTSNCKTCANGFYLNEKSICVKCYSNCKQCLDSSLNSCTDCLAHFTLGELTSNQICINCLFSLNSGSIVNCNALCPNNYTLSQIKYSKDCITCFSSDGSQLYQKTQCINCWINLGLSSGKCIPASDSGYTYYSNDLPNGHADSQLWQGSSSLSALNCTSDYINLYGIPQQQNHTTKVPTTLVYNLKGLPSHRGIIIVFNIFKVGDWFTNSTFADLNTAQIISASVNSPGYQGNTFNITLTNSFGANICGSGGREMIWTIQTDLNDHFGTEVTLTITAPDEGIFVRELEVYLGNCFDCDNVGLSFGLFAIPMYTDNDTQTGLDTWITFNHPVYFAYQSNQSQDNSSQQFIDSFKFTINGTAIHNASLIDNKLLSFNYIKYFLPLSSSFTNVTLTAATSDGPLVYTQDGTVSRQLVSSSQQIQIGRFDNTSQDTRLSISQLSSFFLFFTWFALIVMIICIMLSIGVIFQQFSLMMQLIFYHIYITSQLLPPSIKIPLAHAARMQHLNYFSSISSLQTSLFGNFSYAADYIFQQYNVDVYFLRSFYPIMIINVIYVGWFIINVALYHLISKCKESDHKVIRFFRSIPQRPIAYFDQIWRYQFLATMWACMIQFTNFKGTGNQVISLIICVAAFITAVVWPFVVTIYTYRKHFTMNINHFRYCYHDLYYLKISSVADEPKFYFYVGIRFGKYLAYAIFIAFFINQSIIGPVLLIFFNIIEATITYFLKIYRSGYYLFTRIVENLLLCIVAIICLMIFDLTNSESLNQESYENLGYALATIFILMIVNGIARFFYLAYKKAYEWKIGTYDIGEVGEKQNYDEKGPIRVPQTQRV